MIVPCQRPLPDHGLVIVVYFVFWVQIDTDFKLKDTKEICRLWEGKTETCKKELKGLSKELQNDIEQSVPLLPCSFRKS